jgi:hypothetical protein
MLCLARKTSNPPRKRRTPSPICGRDTTSRGKHQSCTPFGSHSDASRHRLLNRHESEYKKWKADAELQIDDVSFKLGHGLVKAQMGMCAVSYDVLNSMAAKEALVRLPAAKRNVLISVDQLKAPPPGSLSDVQEARRHEVTAAELAAKMGRMGVDQRRQMLDEEEEMRMHHFKTLELFYEALQRTDPQKYPCKDELARQASLTGSTAPQRHQQHGVGAGQPASGPPRLASMPSRPTAKSTAAGHVGTAAAPPTRALAPTKDPRLDPARDPRLGYR